MFSRDQYELLDFGDGRRLERFGSVLVDRPAPAAHGRPRCPASVWEQRHGRFLRAEGQQGQWQWRAGEPREWIVVHDRIRLELSPAPSGHLGVFVEQADNWDWIGHMIDGNPQARVLNLFAYTGAATLAAAAGGARLTHVDSSRPTLQRARRNAALSGLDQEPIRWIVEDVGRYVDRELRRGSRYDAIILDPPSYGHGPGGRSWKIQNELPSLVNRCLMLSGGAPRFLLLSCHTPGITGDDLASLVASELSDPAAYRLETTTMNVNTCDGRSLNCGVTLRVTRQDGR